MSTNIQLDRDLIDEFRDKVNEHHWMSNRLKDVDGKNYWNILCSAMDWIEVAVEGLPTIDLEKRGIGVNFQDTIKLMQYIILIDVLVESIVQVYRVLEGPTAYPYSEENSIFQQSQLSDDKYFKHLRAAFSTHPVNLTSVDGVRTASNERFYASYISRFGLNEDGPPDDYFVSLYSNDPTKDDYIFLGLKIDVTNSYAISRYQLVNDLLAKVESIKQEHATACISAPISTSQNKVEQLEILQMENEKRFGRDEGYSGAIYYLIKLFEIDVNEFGLNEFYKQIFNEYKESLLPGIEIIKEALQSMERGKFYIGRHWTGYEFRKISQFISNGVNEEGEKYFNKMIEIGQLPKELLEFENFILNRMIFDAYFFNLKKELELDVIKLESIFSPIKAREE